MTGIATAVARFGAAFDVRLTTSHAASSPLGLWMLEALLAPTVEGSSHRAELGEALGLEPDEAYAAALSLLREPHPAVDLALAAWARGALLSPVGSRAIAGFPPGLVRRAMPSQAEADAWARERTRGRVDRFPQSVDDPSLAAVFASALAARVSWRRP